MAGRRNYISQETVRPAPRPPRPSPPRARLLFKGRMVRPRAERGGGAGEAVWARGVTPRNWQPPLGASLLSLSCPAGSQPPPPGPRGPANPRPGGFALGAFPGSAEGFPAGISGVALAMSSEERRGAALRARGGGVRSPGSPGRRWGTRASEPKRDFRGSRAQRPGLPALWPWMESWEWGRGLRTP